MAAKPKRAAVTPLDPLDVNGRLYKQISRLLEQLEDDEEELGVTVPQRISALIAIGRIQTIFMGLRKEEAPGHVGSKPQQYSRAFQANAVGRRKKGAGRTRAEPDNVVEFDRGDGDDDATDA